MCGSTKEPSSNVGLSLFPFSGAPDPFGGIAPVGRAAVGSESVGSAILLFAITESGAAEGELSTSGGSPLSTRRASKGFVFGPTCLVFGVSGIDTSE